MSTDSCSVPGQPGLNHSSEPAGCSLALKPVHQGPDDIRGYVRIHERAELVRPGAPRCLKFGPSGRPGIHP